MEANLFRNQMLRMQKRPRYAGVFLWQGRSASGR